MYNGTCEPDVRTSLAAALVIATTAPYTGAAQLPGSNSPPTRVEVIGSGHSHDRRDILTVELLDRRFGNAPSRRNERGVFLRAIKTVRDIDLVHDGESAER